MTTGPQHLLRLQPGSSRLRTIVSAAALATTGTCGSKAMPPRYRHNCHATPALCHITATSTSSTCAQSLTQPGGRPPAERCQPRHVEQLARRAVGLRRVKDDLARKARDLSDQLGQRADRDVHPGRLVKLPQQRGQHVTGVQVEVVVRPVQVGGLKRPGQQAVLGQRLRRMLGIDTRAAEKEQLRNAGVVLFPLEDMPASHGYNKHHAPNNSAFRNTSSQQHRNNSSIPHNPACPARPTPESKPLACVQSLT